MALSPPVSAYLVQITGAMTQLSILLLLSRVTISGDTDKENRLLDLVGGGEGGRKERMGCMKGITHTYTYVCYIITYIIHIHYYM